MTLTREAKGRRQSAGGNRPGVRPEPLIQVRHGYFGLSAAAPADLGLDSPSEATRREPFASVQARSNAFPSGLRALACCLALFNILHLLPHLLDQDLELH